MSKVKFDDEPCKRCGHPRGIHNEVCWGHGYGQDPRCRRKCEAFERDNLIYLERELKKRSHR